MASNGVMPAIRPLASGGQSEIEAMENHSDAFVRARAEKAKQLSADLKTIMSPAGALNLPPLLEARRLAYGIPDGVFAVDALFDRVYVFQVTEDATSTFKGTSIVKPETSKQRERMECPTGIVVSAGLGALDALWSNGVELGHLVNFQKLAVYRLPVDSVGGMDFHVIVLQTGMIVGSRDLAVLRRAGKVKTVAQRSSLKRPAVHVLEDENGQRFSPVTPDMPEE